jgi:hypothetical protein
MARVHAGAKAPYPSPVLDLNTMLPDDLSYIGYIGSLVRTVICVMHAC